jgi:hypothetical protein
MLGSKDVTTAVSSSMAKLTTSKESDRHAKRVIDDAAIWQEKLERLVELRRHASVPDPDALADAVRNTPAS